MDGRAVLIGCPKFDDAMDYADRFAAIFSENDIQDVTVLEMEAPCCAGLHRIVLEGLRRSGRDTPVERVTVSRDGRVLERTRI